MKFKKFTFKKVKSTNDTAIRIIKNTNFKFGMVISDTQLSGKGQYGNKWISYKGNLFVSFFHELKNINVSLSALTKINCLLVKKILTKYRIREKSLQSNNLRNFYWIWKINKDYNNLSFVENFLSLFFITINSLKKYGGKNIIS